MKSPVLPDIWPWVHVRGRLPLFLALLAILSACVPLRYPGDGEPVSVRSGESLVFGRIRVIADDFKGKTGSPLEFFPFSPDAAEHMMPPDPVMSLELRRFEPPGGAFVYKAYPLPKVGKEGAFRWILSAGDYTLASNPRTYGSGRFDPEETERLARFTVPRDGGTIYLGTLVVTISFGLGGVLEAWRKGDTGYGISGIRVLDEREEELLELRGRYPALPEPVATRLMRPE